MHLLLGRHRTCRQSCFGTGARRPAGDRGDRSGPQAIAIPTGIVCTHCGLRQASAGSVDLDRGCGDLRARHHAEIRRIARALPPRGPSLSGRDRQAGESSWRQVLCAQLAKGADIKSLFFYSRVKGETERDILALGFERTVLVQPGLIDGPRPDPRPMEQWAGKVLSVLKPVLPSSMQANRPEAIARAMLDAAIAEAPGVIVVPSEKLV